MRWYLNYMHLQNWGRLGPAEENYVAVDSPGCILPTTDSEMRALLAKLQKKSSWKVINSPDVKVLTSDRVLAYKVLEGKGKIEKISPGGQVDMETYDIEHPFDLNFPAHYWIALMKLKKMEKDIPTPTLTDSNYSKSTMVLCSEKDIKLKTIHFPESLILSSLFLRNNNYGLLISEQSSNSSRKFTKEVLKETSDEITTLK
jgi:hypothetical protein